MSVAESAEVRWWAAAGSGAGATLCSALPVFLLGAAAVQVREDLGFGEAAFGVLVASYFGTAALLSALAGFAAERTGGRRSMLLATAVASLSMLAIGVVVRSWGVLLVCIVLVGTAAALAQPAANLTIARVVPLHRRALALAIKQSAPPAATLVGGVALVAAVPVIGWRPIFVIAAAGAAAFLWWFARRQDLKVPFERSAARSGTTSPRLPLLLLALAALLGSAAANSMAAFFVQGVTAAGQSAAVAGAALTVGSLSGIGARLVLGWAADRSAWRPLPVVVGMFALGSVGVILLAWDGAPMAVFLAATVLGFGAGWGWPGLFNYAVVSAYPLAPAGATGVTQSGMYGGGSLGPALFGLVAERMSFGAAWAGAGVALLLGGASVTAAVVLLDRRGAPSA